MKISVITPSFNQGAFLEDNIQSVLQQNYNNFEHIIIDGGSNDNTIEILKKYSHLKWISEKDEGQSDALNKGFKMATGDIICWLNADDMYLPGAFLHAVKEFQNDRQLDLIYGNYYEVDKNGKIIRHITPHSFDKKLCYLFCYIPSTTVFFRRQIIDEGILIDKTFDISMDKEFFAHLAYLNKKIKYVDIDVAYFRWHDSNKSLDTKQVKRIRMQEGKEIFYRYFKTNVKNKSDFLYKYYYYIFYMKRITKKLIERKYKK